MAFQRPFLISLKRADSSYRWGFSIQGGREYGTTLRIQSVVEDSLAERSGLREGDEIIQVGRVNVQDLTLDQAHEVLARCGNKIEMFVIREDLLSPRKGKEPPVVKAVVHNPYNSPLSLYSTENIAETLAQQTEVLTEGHLSAEEDEGPENLSFKQKSAVFQLLEEQAKQETGPSRNEYSSSQVRKPKVAPPPPPPKPKPPSSEPLHNGYSSSHQQTYQDQQRQVEYQSTHRSHLNQYQYQQEQPIQYQQTTVYKTTSQTTTPGYQSPGYQQSISYQTYQAPQSPTTAYQQSQQQYSYQQSSPGNQSPIPKAHHQQPGYQSPVATSRQQQHPGYQSPTSSPTYQQLNQINYQQTPSRGQTQQQTRQEQQQQVNYQQTRQEHQHQVNYQQTQQNLQQQRQEPQQQVSYQQSQQNLQQHTKSQPHTRDSNYQQSQQTNYQQSQQTNYQQSQQTNYQQKQEGTQQKSRQSTSSAPKTVKFAPSPPPRTRLPEEGSMTAVYKQQYEQHLQKQYEQQQLLMNNYDDDDKPKAHIIEGNIFEHNSTSGTPITYKAPPAAPPKPNWPPAEHQNGYYRNHMPDSPTGGGNVACAWPPRKSTATELPRTGFNPAAVREQAGDGRRCVWPPPCNDEFRSGCSTPQSPLSGRRIQWNPSPSPPLSRRTVPSPSRRKDIPWPPPSGNSFDNKENMSRYSPRMSRKARFDDYVHQHASINVPQTYRPPPGTQHIEFH